MSTTVPETTEKDKLFVWRVAMFEEMGFSSTEAVSLTQAKYTSVTHTKTGDYWYETPLSYKRVQDLLKAGATKDQALRIFL